MSSLPNEKGSIVHVGVKPPGQKKQLVISLIVIVILIAAGGGAWLYFKNSGSSYTLRDWDSAIVKLGEYDESIQASGTVEIPRQVDLPNQTEGYAAALFVSEGDSIKKTDVLASLEIPSLEETLEDYLADLETAKLSLNQTRVEYEYQILELEIDIERLKSDITDAGKEVMKKEQLVAVNASRQSELDTAEDSLENLKELLSDTELNLKKQQELKVLTLHSGEASISQLETRISRTRSELDDANLKSPIEGEVLYINDALSVPGGLIEQNTILFTIADRSSAVIKLEVYEQYAPYLSEGQELILTVGDSKVLGIIESIGQFAQTSSDGLGASVTITVKPDQSGGYLTPGTTAVTDMSLGSRENVMLLPRGSWLTTGSQKWVYVIEGNQAVKTRVTLGDIGDSQVEIISGIDPGDEIIISGYQNFIEYTSLALKEE
ncbi:MAG: efflux RND transporter periplasmic adaptor subunit [Spirochaetales bacterium]|nr:efflux RND transporter periplasmic adaptor subunit [Spirochaetales bacterium]